MDILQCQYVTMMESASGMEKAHQVQVLYMHRSRRGQANVCFSVSSFIQVERLHQPLERCPGSRGSIRPCIVILTRGSFESNTQTLSDNLFSRAGQMRCRNPSVTAGLEAIVALIAELLRICVTPGELG